MIYRPLVSLCLLLLFVSTATAGTDKTVDARSFLTPINSAAKANDAQRAQFESLFDLQSAAAEQAFSGPDQTITLTNVEIPLHGTVQLELERTRAVFDASSQILLAQADGNHKRIAVRPIQSFKGTVNGNPNTFVTLHYNNGELTGFIQHEDGTRSVVGRAWEMRAKKGAQPHAISDENGLSGGPALKDFYCGAEDLPIDTKGALEKMAIPSSFKKGESIQQLPLKEMRLAIVLREDVYETLKRRGYDEEQTAQHFARIVAAMSQAYEEDVRCNLFISYMLIFSEDIPSGYINDGLNPGDLLDEFSRDWSASYNSVDRTVAHLYTNKRSQGGLFVGGIAFGGQAGSRLCVKAHRGAYGVSTMDLVPPNQFPGNPDSRNGFVWDVFVAAHEIGHNVGAAHTHNCLWTPPVDTCQIQSDGTDACYNDPSLKRVRTGTIMSYCHLVNGSSTALTFGPVVSERMRTWMDNSCMTTPQDPYIGITSPRGSETWSGGSKVTIKFVSNGVSNINFHYSLNGTDWVEFAKNIPAADSQYVWTLPTVSAPQLWIRASDAANPNVNYVSLVTYTVSVPIEVTAPAGGERWGIGYVNRIQFRKDFGIGPVNILFSTNGTDWDEIATGFDGTNFEWTIPNSPTSTGRIRVVSVNNANISDESELFSIGTATFDLRLPLEGGFLCNNEENQYRFVSDFIDKIRIQYSTDNGENWRNALQSLTVDAEAWEVWSLNNAMSQVPSDTPIMLQVLESDSRNVLATRENLTMKECLDGPVSVQDERRRLSVGIASVVPNPASTQVQLTIGHAKEGVVEIVAVDQRGASVVLDQNVSLGASGQTTISVPVSSLASGAYRIVVRSGQEIAEAPLQIVR